MDSSWLAIFVGGASSRMGGQPKGLLMTQETLGTQNDLAHAQPVPIVARLLGLAGTLNLTPVFVGKADPYSLRFPDVPVIADDPTDIGPLGGLSGVLKAAGTSRVIAVACDMPQVTSELLHRLQATEPEASVLASKNDQGRWDPLCARYDPISVRPLLTQALHAGVRSFQRLFATLTVTELLLSAEERVQLIDWDTPEDISRTS